ncbi:Ycf51 family protein [Gloeobacter kilaueensis]|uniref:Uncharacterized protein n=1 Tax=Gloeobacter kilaueensis (strain ATCC BAA-2537 / CCAP 1431/1 / ULC 316 / JS1) TaxID=1183438 RepID=U5QHJ7_GLOK1|nr:Ycf51 family protein [Gloeobacter kilaueensis]AGY58442.1 hypothetical protein GKIL_2196 [Gloeobacter kilaueensis JS1]
MNFSGLFTTAGNILGIVTILCAVATLVSWLTKQPWRFRAFGVTAFLVVLTSGVWTLAILPSIVRQRIPGAEKFSVVFDRGGSRAVIAVAATISLEALEKTLRQAAIDTGSSGRVISDRTFVLQARTIVHPRPGVSQIIPVGTLERQFGSSNTEPRIRIDREALARAGAIAAQGKQPVK